MRNIKVAVLSFFTIVLGFSLYAKNDKKVKRLIKKEFNIIKYGAIADGRTLNTQAIQKAINAANKLKSGGTVIFPKGQFLTGSIEMRSNVDLYFADDCLHQIRFTHQLDKPDLKSFDYN